MICRQCGKPFEQGSQRGGRPQIYCSKACRHAAQVAKTQQRQRALRPKTCAECAKPFDPNEKGRPRKFCGDSCKKKFHNRQLRRSLPPLATVTAKMCPTCGELFAAKSRNRKYCYGKACAQAAYRQRHRAGALRLMQPRQVACDGCGSLFDAVHPMARWCSQRCANRYWGGVRARQRRQVSAADYTDLEVFQRDGWRCHICGELIDWTVARTSDNGPTIDHIVPISLGGEDVASNVAAAHWRCNREKRNMAPT